MFVRRVVVCVVVLLAVFAVLTFALAAPKAEKPGNPNPGVVPLTAKVAGMDYGQWSVRYAQWLWLRPLHADLLGDPTAGQDPKSPVLFLPTWRGSGPFNGAITIPPGKMLLVPMTFFTGFFVPYMGCCGSSAGEQIQTLDDFSMHAPGCLAAWVDSTMEDPHATVDGRPVCDPQQYRATSQGVYLAEFPVDSILAGLPCGIENTSVWALSDGYWLFLKPLSVGNHLLSFGTSAGEAVLQVTVAPEKKK